MTMKKRWLPIVSQVLVELLVLPLGNLRDLALPKRLPLIDPLGFRRCAWVRSFLFEFDWMGQVVRVRLHELANLPPVEEGLLVRSEVQDYGRPVYLSSGGF